MRFRFPPSPTGHLHVGNVRTALFNWLLAKKQGGSFVLRIEDTDEARSTKQNEEQLLEDLKWLGLDWDEGPRIGGPNGPYRQSERRSIYQEKCEELLASGGAYQCFCTPEELETERKRSLSEKRPPRYSGKCRGLDKASVIDRIDNGEKPAIRFRVEPGGSIEWDDLVHGPTRFERDIIGDFVIVRSGGMPAYNFAVVVDDASMGITDVIRGDDHISNTPRQILLYKALSFSEPTFGHLPMILGQDGSRLSKRHGATSVQQFRERGYLPHALINFLALQGWNPGTEMELFTLEELIDDFSLKRVNKAASIFNFAKLDWINGQYMRAMSPQKLFAHTKPFLLECGYLPEELSPELEAWFVELVDTFNSGSSLTEIVAGAVMAFDFDAERDLSAEQAGEVLANEQTLTVISAFEKELSALPPEEKISPEIFKACLKTIQKESDVKGKQLFQPVRLAVTGRVSGPELAKFVPLLEHGVSLPLPMPVLGVRERVRQALKTLMDL